MSLTLDNNNASYQIRGFKPGQIQINDQILTHSLILTAEKLIPDWKPQNITELSSDDFTMIIDLKPTILLLGTGSNLQFPPLDVYGELINHGIGVEVMNTRAACHTFNVLTSEGRNVAAALIIDHA